MTVTVLIGPSGVGKSTLLAAVAELRPVRIVRTVTTRPRRPGEDDTTHQFVDAATFATLQEQGRFLGLHRHYGHDYGLPALTGTGTGPSAGPVLTCLRAAVVERLRHLHPDLDVIALDAPIPVLLERLTARGDHQRADPGALRAEAAAGRGLADLVLDATEPVAELAAQLAVRLARPTGRAGPGR